MKTTIIITIVLTGLSAGFFYAWAVSVIPGTKRIPDTSYLETMQSINRAILNPAFFLIFFGPIIGLVASSFFQYREGMDIAFWLMVGATLAYVAGTFGVTAFGNVPLNDQLDIVKLEGMGLEQMKSLRQRYEPLWNRLHTIRTLFSVVSFVLVLLAAKLGS